MRNGQHADRDAVSLKSATAGLSEDEITRELARLLSAPDLEVSARNRKFLTYIVEETLAGRGDRIKAYTVATSVFGRSENFDPLQDSIVRIEAGRLRRAIDHHYATSGSNSPIRIRIPKGTYAPDFLRVTQEQVTPVPTETHNLAPRILVRTFEQQSWDRSCPDISRTLTLQVISALTRFTDLFVYAFDTTLAADEKAGEPSFSLDYELIGTITLLKTRLHADFLLRQVSGGRYVWAKGIDRVLNGEIDPASLITFCGEIAGEVASTLAQRDGIMESQAREAAGHVPREFSAYLKLVEFQDYWRTLDLSRFQRLRLGFEAAVRDDPHFAAGHACLSLLYSDAARYAIDCGADVRRPLDRALELAEKAVRLAPSSGRAHHARGVAEWFLGKSGDALRTLKIAHELNPNDPELMAEFGIRSAMRMDWDVAAPLLTESYKRNPLQSVQYRMGLFFHHFWAGDYEKALEEAMLTRTPLIAHPHIACAAALGAMGRRAEGLRYLQMAHDLAPDLLPRLREDLAFRQIHPDLIEAVASAVEQLRFVAPSKRGAASAAR